MRLILTILFLCSIAYGQTNYYVDSSKSDSNNGLTPATAWKTIAKVNASTFSPDDSVLFNRGQSWNEQLKFPSSGTSGHPINVGAYGTGAIPIITGLQTVTGWTDSTGNFWVASVPNSVPSQNTVLIDGVQTKKGRYPNSTYINALIGSYHSFAFFAGLPYDFTGAEVVMKNYVWIWDVTKITSQTGLVSGDSIYVQTPFTYNSNWIGYSQFFIQNSIKCLDQQNEWAYDSLNKKLYIYSSTQPNAQISTIDTIVYCKQNYVSFNNLHIIGANCVGICADTSTHVIIKNCKIEYGCGWYSDFSKFGGGAGGAGIRAQAATYMKIDNDSILNVYNDAIYSAHGSNNANITNNYIKNTGTSIGMGSGGNAAYVGIYADHDDTISNNTLINTGYTGIYFNGVNNYIYRNYVDSFCVSKNDGGGIYSFNGGAQTGSYVGYNIVGDGIGIGYPVGTFSPSSSGTGCAPMYLDNESTGVTIDHNTFFNGYQSCFSLTRQHIGVTNNTIVDSLGVCFSTPAGVSYSYDTIYNNIIYQKNKTLLTINNAGGTNSTFLEDSNYLLRPDSVINQFKISTSTYSLSGWIAATGFDAHSSLAPLGITSGGTLYINPTIYDSTLSFSSRKVDAKGTVYFRNTPITIHPYQSIILFDIPSSDPKSVGGYLFY